MKSFNKLLELEEQKPGIWYARVLVDIGGGQNESMFLKFKQKKKPKLAEMMPEITAYIEHQNNPPQLPTLIPEELPEIPGLTAAQRVTLGQVWNLLKAYFRNLIGRP